MTVRDAYYVFLRYDTTRVNYEVDNEKIVVNYSPKGSRVSKYFLLKLQKLKQIAQLKKCKLIHRYPEHDLYVFETKADQAEVYYK